MGTRRLTEGDTDRGGEQLRIAPVAQAWITTSTTVKWRVPVPTHVTFDTENVVAHLRSHAGEALQAVVVYDDQTHRDLYRRDDLREMHGSDLEGELLAEARRRPRRESPESGLYEGPLAATVHVFAGRVVLNLPRDDDSGTLVLLDPSVARNLTEFIADIRGDLYE